MTVSYYRNTNIRFQTDELPKTTLFNINNFNMTPTKHLVKSDVLKEQSWIRVELIAGKYYCRIISGSLSSTHSLNTSAVFNLQLFINTKTLTQRILPV